MIVLLQPGADPKRVAARLAALGVWSKPLAAGDGRTLLAIEPHSAAVPRSALLAVEGVAELAAEASGHPRVDAQRGTVEIAGVPFGEGHAPVVMAGPCSVESEEQIRAIAARLAARGVRFLRGGAFKPRTSPYSFQGHGDKALPWLRAAADEHGLAVVTELLDPRDAARVARHADLIQIGSRSMQSFPLLAAAGETGKPVLLKRGMSATVEEWLQAAEWALVHGAASVVFCERGIRGFDPSTRNLLDLSAVALLAHAHGLPVIVDPSHAAGRRDLIVPLAKAAIAAGAAGILVETHDDPAVALSDGPQALDPPAFDRLSDALGLPRPRARKVGA